MKHKNKSKGDMFDWIDATWNPIRGRCPHNCAYCYMRGFWEKGFIPEEPAVSECAYEAVFTQDEKIFVGSSIDIFADKIPTAWTQKVIDFCHEWPGTIFLFLTKNPGRYHEFKLAKNFIAGATIESNRYHRKFMGNAPAPGDRIQAMKELEHPTKFICIEPIMAFDIEIFGEHLAEINAAGIQIGADSKGHGLPEPTRDDIEYLVAILDDSGAQVEPKKNLRRITG